VAAAVTSSEFLQWALPRLQLRWAGFRRNARQVAHRIERRRAALGLADLVAYRALLEANPDEWAELDRLCRVTISRFARDRPVWDELVATELPRLAREARSSIRAWSAGCGAGEEPYTLAIAWQLAVDSGLAIEIIATDRDEVQLRRAAAGEFPIATLRELPESWQDVAFDPGTEHRRLRDRFRATVTYHHHDVRSPPPDGAFDLVLCRNLAFSYFDEAVQRSVATTFRNVLRDGGVLVVGKDEQPPAGVGFAIVSPCIYRAVTRPAP
jgi:chemotaxis protein methyltransferase CheR